MLQPTTLLADPSLGLPRARIGAGRWASVRPRSPLVSWRWFAIVAVMFVVFAGLAFLRVWPPLATVMSGSMSPTINTGDMVVLQRLDRPARVGDIVVVNVPDDARSRYGYPPVVIHRIFRIAADGTATTKGDARKEPDPFTIPRRAIGAHVIAHVPGGGRVLAFLTSPLGLLWLGGGGLMLIGLPLLERRRDGQRTVAGELQQLRVERTSVEERCDALSQELARVTQAFTEHLAALPSQLEAAVAAAVATRPAEIAEPELAETEPEEPPAIAHVAAAAWAEAELPFPPTPPARPAYTPVPPIAFVAAVVPTVRRVPAPAPKDPLDQLELALFACPRTAAAADESEDQLAFALDVERAPRFARPCEHQLAFALEGPAANPDQLVISTPPPGPRWDTPPQSIVVRRRSGGLVGRALSLLAA